MDTSYPLPAWHSLSVSVLDGKAHVRQIEDPTIAAAVSAAHPAVFGPYPWPRNFRVQDSNKNAVVEITEGAVKAIPAESAPGDVVELVGEGAPVASAQASIDINPTGNENGLTFTAVEYGEGGNEISIEYVDPGGTTATLAVSANEKAITVRLGRAANAINTTAAALLAAIEAHDRASELVTVEIMTADGGGSDDGSGLVTAMARTYLEDGAGTGAGIAGPGSRYTDTDTPAVYLNTGTKAQPVWTELAQAS